MNRTAASAPDARRTGRIRLAGIAVLVALAAVIGSDAAFTSGLRAAWFDACQTFSPRTPKSAPAVIVEIDQKSLKAIGQWPWPRSVMAELVEATHRHKPAALALDIVMPEVDASSPERLLARAQKGDAALAAALAARPSNDMLLASALAGSNAVLAVAGMPGATGMKLRATPFTVHASRDGDPVATTRSFGLARYQGALTSIDALDRAAAGRGLISVDPEGGVIRRIPLVASIGDTLVPALAIEMLRTAIGAPTVRLKVSGSKIEGIETGDLAIPTESDGAVRIYYSPPMPGRFVSAIDVLEGRSTRPRSTRRKQLRQAIRQQLVGAEAVVELRRDAQQPAARLRSAAPWGPSGRPWADGDLDPVAVHERGSWSGSRSSGERASLAAGSTGSGIAAMAPSMVSAVGGSIPSRSQTRSRPLMTRAWLRALISLQPSETKPAMTSSAVGIDSQADQSSVPSQSNSSRKRLRSTRSSLAPWEIVSGRITA